MFNCAQNNAFLFLIIILVLLSISLVIIQIKKNNAQMDTYSQQNLQHHPQQHSQQHLQQHSQQHYIKPQQNYVQPQQNNTLQQPSVSTVSSVSLPPLLSDNNIMNAVVNK